MYIALGIGNSEGLFLLVNYELFCVLVGFLFLCMNSLEGILIRTTFACLNKSYRRQSIQTYE